MNVKLYAMTCDRITELWRWGWRVSPDGYRAIVEYARMAWEATQALVKRHQAVAETTPPLLAWETLAELLILILCAIAYLAIGTISFTIAAGREFRCWADAAIYGGQWWGEKFWAVYRAPERLLCVQVAY